MSIIPIIFLVLLFGFGTLGSTESTFESSVEPAPPAASPASPGYESDLTFSPKLVRAMFDNRETLPACETWECLEGSVDGNGAELVQVATTVEGDPITTYYRVKPGGEYEIFTDNSQDSFRGDPAWVYDVCPVPADVRAGCIGS
jgi:hypothetical protein